MTADERLADEALDEIIADWGFMQDVEAYRRRKAFEKKVKWARIKVLLTIPVILFVVCLYFVQNWRTYVTDYDAYGYDTRTCRIQVGENVLTGTRTYGYRFMTVLGHRIFMTPDSEMDQETRIDITGIGMTIIMHMSDGTDRQKTIKDGEKFRQFLDRADAYSFVMDGENVAAAVKSKNLCR